MKARIRYILFCCFLGGGYALATLGSVGLFAAGHPFYGLALASLAVNGLVEALTKKSLYVRAREAAEAEVKGANRAKSD